MQISKAPREARWKSRTVMNSYFPVLLYANERLYVDGLSGDLQLQGCEGGLRSRNEPCSLVGLLYGGTKAEHLLLILIQYVCVD